MVRLSAATEAVVWHDVECAGYGADLALWRELADMGPGPILELGCGTGRVALDLAARGHDVAALDSDPDLVGELRARAHRAGLRVRCEVGDARSFELGSRFALALAPMQVVQLLGGPAGRESLLRCVGRHLLPGGLLAAALADPFEGIPAADARPPLPDVREENGWVYSSTPVAVRPEPDGAVAIDRLRQAVSPSGELSEAATTLRLDAVRAEELEQAGADLGFRPLPARHVAPTDAYVGSVVVLLERP
jgi:SAM-dependent methyltransferase